MGDAASIKSIDDLSRTVCDFAVEPDVRLEPQNTEAVMRARGLVLWPC
jgi:hypothetical protein